MNNSTKAISLVAVLALCCAALAGSAYAYTATYVDTIGDQDIEDVYLSVSATQDGYGDFDLDIVYDTLVPKDGNTYYRLTKDDVGVALIEDAAVDNAIVKADGKSVRFVLLIDTLSITAHGDDAVVASVAATASKTIADAAHGATAFLYLSLSEVAAAEVANLAEKTTLNIDADDGAVAVGDTLEVYAYIVIDVAQLDGDACTVTEYTDYYLSTKVGLVEIPGFDVVFVATAAQDTA